MDKDRISRLGFNDQQKGQLVAALLLKLPNAEDREFLFNDTDAVVKASLDQFLPGSVYYLGFFFKKS